MNIPGKDVNINMITDNLIEKVRENAMAGIKQKSRARKQRKRILYHKQSILMISGVMLFLVVVITVGGMSLKAKNAAYQEQQEELQSQIDEAKERADEIDDLEEYVGSDSYTEEVAREKLGLVYPDEIILEPEN